MKNNSNFRNDFIFKYLSILVKYDNKEVFIEYYEKVKDYLSFLAKNTKDVRVLRELNSIFDYRMKMLEIQL